MEGPVASDQNERRSRSKEAGGTGNLKKIPCFRRVSPSQLFLLGFLGVPFSCSHNLLDSHISRSGCRPHKGEKIFCPAQFSSLVNLDRWKGPPSCYPQDVSTWTLFCSTVDDDKCWMETAEASKPGLYVKEKTPQFDSFSESSKRDCWKYQKASTLLFKQQ